MLVLREGKLEKMPLAKWIAAIESATPGAPPSRESGTRSTSALPGRRDRGSAALCRVEIERDGKHVFTDFLNLYKFEDGWKIVGKTFTAIPKPSRSPRRPGFGLVSFGAR
jgi:hypothetical protein